MTEHTYIHTHRGMISSRKEIWSQASESMFLPPSHMGPHQPCCLAHLTKHSAAKSLTEATLLRAQRIPDPREAHSQVPEL